MKIRRRACAILAGAALCGGIPAAGAATPTHHRHAHAARPVAVALSQQNGSPLDDAARRLLAHDIAQSTGSGETPVVLVGSARLSTRPGRGAALFVQLQSAALCGSAGCDTSVYLPDTQAPSGWTKVLDSVSGPITVLPSSHGHMHDLVVGASDRWVWSGSAYRDTVSAPPLVGLKRSVERHERSVERNGGVSPPPP